MSKTVIKVENLSKQYRLGTVGTGTLSHDINRWWHMVRGKEDPFLKVGDENNRATKASSDYVWALKDINFTVGQGEVLGIIGRNGAGKSTLLKLLSRTTVSTTGSIKVKGRIASLLEVGTGFHPELTGKENIYLNGAILGMSKREITKKFDEIVDFSGVERYIDTPVKRYSSGMYVRLAFAVAAHLEPEILILDEVLAVGDVEFQKKCLGKMKDVSVSEGRTVLFVSHNMTAVQTMCDRCLLMNYGTIVNDGSAFDMVKKYYQLNKEENKEFYQSSKGYISFAKVFNRKGNKFYDISEELLVEISLQSVKLKKRLMISLDLLNHSGIIVNSSRYYVNNDDEKDEVTLECTLPGGFLNTGEYMFSIYLMEESMVLQSLTEVLHFEMDEQRTEQYLGTINGVVRKQLEWKERAATAAS